MRSDSSVNEVKIEDKVFRRRHDMASSNTSSRPGQRELAAFIIDKGSSIGPSCDLGYVDNVMRTGLLKVTRDEAGRLPMCTGILSFNESAVYGGRRTSTTRGGVWYHMDRPGRCAQYGTSSFFQPLSG